MARWSEATAGRELPGSKQVGALRYVGAIPLAITLVAPGNLFEDGAPVARPATGVATGILGPGCCVTAAPAGAARARDGCEHA